jgi:hypothetical protein
LSARDWRATRERDTHAAARTSRKSKTPESLIVGVGASGALLAGAAIVFITLLGLVSFNVWPAGRGGSAVGNVELQVSSSGASHGAGTPLGAVSGQLASTGPSFPAPPTDDARGGDGGGGGDARASRGKRGTGGGGSHARASSGTSGGSEQPPLATTAVTPSSSDDAVGNGNGNNGNGNGHAGGNGSGNGGDSKTSPSHAGNHTGADKAPPSHAVKGGSDVGKHKGGSSSGSGKSKGGGGKGKG